MAEAEFSPAQTSPAQPQASFPFPAGPVSSPPAAFEERRRTCPFGEVRIPSGGTAIMLTKYQDVAAAVADPRLSHNLTAPGSPRTVLGANMFDDPNNLTNKEGPEHLRLRRIIAPAFTPRRAEKWRPAIRAAAAQLLAGLEQAGPPADLVNGYCLPLSVGTMWRMLGVPERDRERFRAWSNAFLSGAPMDPQEQYRRIGEFAGYVAGLLAERRAAPGDSLIDDLIAARDGADQLTEPELVNLVVGLIAAGNEALNSMLSRAVLTLLTERALWEQLLAKPDLIPAAVNELLRVAYPGPVGVLRVATEDVALPSGMVKAGQAILMAANIASLDPEAYPDPFAVRFDRDAPPQLTFGGGPHYCLGAHLARVELGIGLEVLLERLPGLRLAAEPEQLPFSEGEFVSSLLSLPVAW